MRLSIAASFCLLACTPHAQEQPIIDMPPQASCGAEKLQHLVGGPLGAFDFHSLAQPLRIIPPGTAVTMDYSPRRLNVDLDENDLIVRIWCG